MKKAQDVNFNLNLSRTETNDLYKNIHNMIRREVGSSNIIPDDADIKVYEVNNTNTDNNTKDLLRIMRTANRQDMFVYLRWNNKPYLVVQDYSIKGMDTTYFDKREIDNPTIAIKSARKILQIRIDEIIKNKELSESRAIRELSQTEERERFNQRGKMIYNSLRDQVQNSNKELIKTISKYERIDVSNIVAGDIISYNDKDRKVSDIRIVDDERAGKVFEILFTDGERTKVSTYSDLMIRLSDDRIRNTLDSLESLDFVELARRGQSFPYKYLISLTGINRSVIRRLQWQYNDLRHRFKHINRNDSKGNHESAFKKFKNNLDKDLYNETSDMSYRDRSGYINDLSKYLTKLEVKSDSGVPRYIQDTLSKLNDDVNDAIKKSIPYINRAIEKGNFSAVENISGIISRISLGEHGSNNYNHAIDRLTDPESYKNRENFEFVQRSHTIEVDNIVRVINGRINNLNELFRREDEKYDN